MRSKVRKPQNTLKNSWKAGKVVGQQVIGFRSEFDDSCVYVGLCDDSRLQSSLVKEHLNKKALKKMLLSPDDNIIKKGFCFGRFEATIDATSRLRLNNSIVTILQEHKISSLWRYPDPTGKRFILCPPEHRPNFLKIAKKHLPESMEIEEALRLFIFSGTEAAIDDQGRISILKCCLKNSEIKPPQRVSIWGVGLWYEVTAQQRDP